MNTSTVRLMTAAATLVSLTLAVGAQERDRSKIQDELKWNLADLYPSDAA